MAPARARVARRRGRRRGRRAEPALAGAAARRSPSPLAAGAGVPAGLDAEPGEQVGAARDVPWPAATRRSPSCVEQRARHAAGAAANTNVMSIQVTAQTSLDQPAGAGGIVRGEEAIGDHQRQADDHDQRADRRARSRCR